VYPLALRLAGYFHKPQHFNPFVSCLRKGMRDNDLNTQVSGVNYLVADPQKDLRLSVFQLLTVLCSGNKPEMG
jgi:hypothetical protein